MSGLKKYRVVLNGTEMIVKIADEDLSAYSNAVLVEAAPVAKQAKAPANKARKPANKAKG